MQITKSINSSDYWIALSEYGSFRYTRSNIISAIIDVKGYDRKITEFFNTVGVI